MTFIPDEYVAEAIAGGIGDVRDKRILLPRADIARKALAVELTKRGALVHEVAAYRTLPAAPDPMCGLLNTGGDKNPHLPEGYVLNDETLEVLAKVAVSHAQAGADIVAPSGMIDGMVAAIRAGLDGAGFDHLPILSYSTKYASGFYGPFREAAQGAPKFGDRRTHQMDPANAREAQRETALDVAEGADMIMVKPALPYLDIICQVRDNFPQLPLAAYSVSGEYAMVKAAAANGWLDEERAVLEILTGIKRAGADLIITYHARDAARWLK